MDHDTLTSLDCCAASWPLTMHEREQAALDGIPFYATAGLEHLCCLEPDHEDAHACQCGVSA